jgi:DNA-directed RNA polymerase specialized sigma24 family protein
MENPDDITAWVARLKAGDPAAAQPLWEAYFHRLVSVARQRLLGYLRAPADEESVALSAFDSFCRAAKESRFPRLEDRDDVWQLLVLLTARKAAHLRRREGRKKRGGGTVQHLSALPDGGAEPAKTSSPEPTPEFAAYFAEEVRNRLDELRNDDLRAVALAKLDGYTNAENAARLGVVERTVERRLRIIRQLWSEDGSP